MAAIGRRVMMARSIEIARSYGVPLHVRSTFGDGEGTWIGEEDELVLEKAIVSGVTHDTSEAKVDDPRRPRPPRRRRARVPRARRRRREHRHDRPERLGGRARPTSRSRCRRPTSRPPSRSSTRSRSEIGARGVDLRPRHREGLARRRRHEEPSRASPPTCSRRSPRQGSTSRSSRPRRSASRASSAPPRSSAPCSAVHERFRLFAEERRRCADAAHRRRRRDRRRRRGHAPAAPRARLRRTCASSPRRARPARSSAGVTVEEATPEALAAATSTSSSSPSARAASRELVPHAVRGGAVAIDKSSAYRLEPGIPLVVPEVNGDRALEHDGIVANPNCCTIPLTCVLKPLHDAAGLARVRVATYQSVSGAGAQRDGAAARPSRQDEHDLRMDWDFDGDEIDEESKIRAETQKILELPDLPISATTRPRAGARRPRRGGLDRARGRRSRPSRRARAARAARRRCGSSTFRRPARRRATTRCSSAASARDPTVENGLALFLACDNLVKGAALNAIQIAELLLTRAASPRSRLGARDHARRRTTRRSSRRRGSRSASASSSGSSGRARTRRARSRTAGWRSP